MKSSSSTSSLATSRSLIVRVQSREDVAWQRLIDLYGPLVFGWGSRAGLSSQDAADVMQEVFASVAKAIGRFDAEADGRFRGWLWTITRNKIRDHYSLGATLYKLLSGCSPHTIESAEPALAKLRRIASESPVSLRQRCAELPADLCKLVDRMLARDPDDRVASMPLLADAVAGYCKNSDLPKRVKEAMRHRERNETPPNWGMEDAVQVQNAQLPPKRPSKWSVIAAGGFFFLAAALGIVVTLQTTAGQLIIETSTPDVEVRVLKAGQPYKQFTLTQKAETLKLGAGQYAIEIVSDADGLEIQNDTYTLKRGDIWLAKIAHRDGGTAEPIAVSDQPTFEGKTLDQWIALVEQERSPKQLYEATQAMKKLAIGDRASNAIDVVISAMHFHRYNDTVHDDAGTALRLGREVEEFLASRDQSLVIDRLTQRLQDPNEGEIGLILYYIQNRFNQLKNFVTADFVAAVEGIPTDELAGFSQGKLVALRLIGSESQVRKHLIEALANESVNLRLYAARELIGLEANPPELVPTLVGLLDSESLRQRAEAAWLLGDLGTEAKSATEKFISIVKDEDEEVSRAAAFRPQPIDGQGFTFSGYVSVKDAAIRALVEMADESVVPVLLEEWKRRRERPSRSSRPAWQKSDGSAQRANSYTDEWVADAIEQLIGMRPDKEDSAGRDGPTVSWTVDGLDLNRIYKDAFIGLDISKPLVEMAGKILSRSDESRLLAWMSIESARLSANREIIEIQMQLLVLLAQYDDPRATFKALLSRMEVLQEALFKRAEDKPIDPILAEQATEILAMHQAAAQTILRQIDDWQTVLLPGLIESIERNGSPFETQIAFDAIASLPQAEQTGPYLQLIAVFSQVNQWFVRDQRIFETIKEIANQLRAWIANDDHRTQLQACFQGGNTLASWDRLAAGMLSLGISDEGLRSVIMNRFDDGLSTRDAILLATFRSLQLYPSQAELLIDLLQHPALDREVGKGDQRTIRASKYLPMMGGYNSAELRPKFRPLLETLTRSEKPGEKEAAEAILKHWN